MNAHTPKWKGYTPEQARKMEKALINGLGIDFNAPSRGRVPSKGGRGGMRRRVPMSKLMEKALSDGSWRSNAELAEDHDASYNAVYKVMTRLESDGRVRERKRLIKGTPSRLINEWQWIEGSKPAKNVRKYSPVVLREKRREDITAILTDTPGMTGSEVAKVLDVVRTTAQHAMRLMYDEGLLIREKTYDGCLKYYVRETE